VRALTTTAFVVAGVACLQVPAALAQPDRQPRFELAIGSLWIGHQPLGSSSANETTSTAGSLKLFETSSDLAGAAGVDGRAGVRVTRSLVAEVEASYAKPQLRIAISNDFEGAAQAIATETVQQFMIGAGVAWYLPGRARGARLSPFAMAGGGYLRQLHDQATLVQAGRFYQFGGGVAYLLASRPRFHLKGIGARADVRAIVRSKGVAFDTAGHTSPAVGGTLFVRF
jgi:hypothetical protein